MPITTSHWGKALWPGINKWFQREYGDWPTQWTEIFTTYKSRKAFEEDVGYMGLGYAQEKPELGSVSYDTEQQGWVARYNHTVWALGFIISWETMEDDQYDIVGPRRSKGLARSLHLTKEVNAANILNRAWNASYTGGDGVTLVAASGGSGDSSHPLIGGGSFENGPQTAIDLSEGALEQAVIDIGKWTDERGLKIPVYARKLVIPDDSQFEADRILNTDGRVGTANNDRNSLKMMGKIPEGYCLNRYLTDSDSWYLLTDVQDGFKHWERSPMMFDEDNDTDTRNAKYIALERYSFGWTDPRCVYASEGES